MIRRRLLAILAGVFVFAIVIGSAALLNVDSDTLVAGTDLNLACDTDVTVEYTTPHSTSGWEVVSVTVSGIADPACVGATLSVDLHDGNNATIEILTKVISGSAETLLLTTPESAENIYGVAVLITGPVA